MFCFALTQGVLNLNTVCYIAPLSLRGVPGMGRAGGSPASTPVGRCRLVLQHTDFSSSVLVCGAALPQPGMGKSESSSLNPLRSAGGEGKAAGLTGGHLPGQSRGQVMLPGPPQDESWPWAAVGAVPAEHVHGASLWSIPMALPCGAWPWPGAASPPGARGRAAGALQEYLAWN